MEGAGKWVEDDELREAMQEKGLGTPATRAAIIEGLLTEKYMLREGRELIPTAKAFQLMTLLRGLQVEELTRPELTGEWEYKLAQIEQGKSSRAAFMREIADMTERVVKKAKEYDRDSVPGDYATLSTPCPHCGGVVQENYRRYACTGKTGEKGAGGQGCGFSFTKTPGGRTFATEEAEQFLRDRRIGPLEGFRSKAGWPFVAELALVPDGESGNFKLEFDFGDNARAGQDGEIVDLSHEPSLGACPKCGAAVKAFGKNYLCERGVPTQQHPAPTCDFKSGQLILQQSVTPEQMSKLLLEGKTDVLDKFVSQRTRRPFKARLAWSAQEGKVIFEFEQREGARKYPARAAAAKPAAASAPAAKTTAKKTPAKTAAASAAKAPRAGSLKPSAALAAVIGPGPFGRGEVMKLLWDYIKAHNLQDPSDKRTIRADAKLRSLFNADSVGMFKLAGIVGGHLKQG
jgi:DNA topoisomerase-3